MKDIDNKDKLDFFIETNNNWGRIRACGIIIENDCILMVTNESVDFYYSVGGAVHIGESSEDACRREVFEETGINYEIDRLAFIHENFFIGEDNDNCHEIAFYYLMKSKGNQDLDSNSYSMHGVKENLKWISLKDYGNYIAYPEFFKDELLNISHTVKHIVSYENK